MPANQQYATNVPQTFITGQINPTATVMSVNSSSGWPSVFPFTAVLEIGTSLQEPIDVTNVSGTTWTIVRAIDGTVGFTHNPNATVTHADIGRDFRESRSHIDAATSPDATGSDVHGIGNGNAVVGTGTAQTVTNKAFGTGNTYPVGVSMGTAAWGGGGPLTEQTLSFTGLTGATAATSRLAGSTSTGGPPVGGTFLTGDVVEDQLFGALWICTAGGTPGTWAPVGGRVLLGTISPSSTATTFANATLALPAAASNFKHLEIEYSLQISGSTATGPTPIFMQLSGISTNYNWTRITFNNGGALGTAGTDGASNASVGLAWNSNTGSPTNGQGVGKIVIPNFNSTSFKRAWESTAGGGDGTTASTQMVSTFSGSVNSTAAVTSVAFATSSAGTWTAGSKISVYAIS